jgi:hypothetical protein
MPARRAAAALATALVLLPAPARGDFSEPSPVTEPVGGPRVFVQATDLGGATTYAVVEVVGGEPLLTLRRRAADGSLGPTHPVAAMPETRSVLDIAVDDDGDGMVVWDQNPFEPGNTAYLHGQRFDADGPVGPVLDLTPADHWVSDGRVAMTPGGRAVVSWSRYEEPSYGTAPYARWVSRTGELGAVHRLGDVPDAPAPWIAVERSGRTTLLWTNRSHLYARRLTDDDGLTPLRRVRERDHRYEFIDPTDVGVDRHGRITASCTRWTPNTSLVPGESNARELGCWLRIDSRLRLVDEDRRFTPHGEPIDRTMLGVAPDGTAVVGWQRNYFEGAFVRTLDRRGRLGPVHRVADGGLHDVALSRDGDGVVVSTGLDGAGHYSRVRVTAVRDGRLGRTTQVGRNDYDTGHLYADPLPRGRSIVSWGEVLEGSRVMVVTGR